MKATCSILITALLMLGAGAAAAQETTQATKIGSTTTEASLDYPPGYMALILDLDGIETRMTLEQKTGKGSHWPQWLRPGLAEGNSLYWWMLAKWHHNAGNRDVAYRSLLTAWVLTRMETRSCSAKDAQIPTRILRLHQDVLDAGTTSNKVNQESVLYALSMARSFTANTTPLRGMSCNIDPARRALEDQRKQLEAWKKKAEEAKEDGKRPPVWRPGKARELIDYRVGKSQDDRHRFIIVQLKELEEVSQEFQGDRAREKADINTIMRTMDRARAGEKNQGR